MRGNSKQLEDRGRFLISLEAPKICTATALQRRNLLVVALFIAASACTTNDHANAPPEMNTATQLTQLLLDSKALIEYFHFGEAPERIPLAIHNATSTDLEISRLYAGGEPVVDASKDGKNVLKILKLEVDDESAEIYFAYYLEGISGTAPFSLANDVWHLSGLNIVERKDEENRSTAK